MSLVALYALHVGFAFSPAAPKEPQPDRSKGPDRLLMAIVALSILAVLVAAVAIGNFVSYYNDAANVHITDEVVSRPNLLVPEVEVSFVLRNDGSCDATVVVEYWFKSDVRGIAAYDIGAGEVRTVSKIFSEPEDGPWDVRMIEVMLR